MCLECGRVGTHRAESRAAGRVQMAIVLQNMWESQGGQSRPASHNLPRGGGSEPGSPLTLLWEGR